MSSSSDTNEGVERPPDRRKRARSDRRQNGNEQTAASQEVGIMRGGDLDSRAPKFIGSASGIHFIRTVYDMLAQKTGQNTNQPEANSPGDVVPGEDDELSSASPAALRNDGGQTSNIDPFWLANEVNPVDWKPSFDDMVSWTRKYFENWHPIFPFLHAPSVLEVFDRIGRGGMSTVSQPNQVIIQSLMSISLADSRQSSEHFPPVPSYMVFSNVEHLMNDIQFAICQPGSLENLQVLIAAQLFLVSMLKFNFASRIGGTIVRMAFHLGLHRCPTRFRNFSLQQSQIRRRVFFTVYCLDRILCQSLGLPLGINDTDTDVCYPGEERHLRQGEEENEKTGDERQLITLNLFSKHAQLRGMILELRNKTFAFRHETIKRTMAVQTELSKWSNQVHEIVEDVHPDQPEQNTNDAPISPSHTLYLLLLEHESIIALNRPLITKISNSTGAQSALQNCIQASRSIINILDKFLSEGSSGREQAARTPLVWPLVTWCVWMSCFILAYAALEGRSKLSFAIRQAEKTLRILNHVSLRKTLWPEVCAHAVRHLKTALVDTSAAVGDQPSQTESRLQRAPFKHDRQASSTLYARQAWESAGAEPSFTRSSPASQPEQIQPVGGYQNSATMADSGQDNNQKAPDTQWSRHSSNIAPSHAAYELPFESPQSAGYIDLNSHTSQYTELGENFNLGSFQDQGFLDPFSAIDFSNFSLLNHGFPGDFGPV